MRNGCLLFYFSYIIYLIINKLSRKYENMRNEIEKSFLVPHITKKQDQLPAILLHRNALKCWEVTLYVKVTEKPITDFYYDVPQTA